MSTGRAAIIAVCCLAVACDGGGGHEDGGTGEAGMARLEIGTGRIGVFETLPDDGTALLAKGCQGSQHVWISLRTWGLDTVRALVSAELRVEGETEPQSVPLQLRLTFEEPAGEDYHELTGLQLIVPEPALVEGKRCIIEATVSETASLGATATDTRRVLVEWGPEVCGAEDGGTEGGTADAGEDDAGVDAGVDASIDAGTDASADAA